MALTTRPTKSQIAYYEKINVIENASGFIELDMYKSTSHLILNPIENCAIRFKPFSPTYLMPNNSYVEIFLVISPSALHSVDKIIQLDPDIYWDYLEDTFFQLKLFENLIFHFFTIDNGKRWNGQFLGNFNYTVDQAVIQRPTILYPPDNSVCIANFFNIKTTPFTTTIISDTPTDTVYKITNDIDGQDIVYQETSSDVDDHILNPSILENEKEYYLFVQYNGTIIHIPSHWSHPVKFKLLNIPLSNPKDWDKSKFDLIKDPLGFKYINRYNRTKSLVLPTYSKPIIIELLDLFDESLTNPIPFVLSGSDNILEIKGCSGVLLGLNIKYQYDYTKDFNDLKYTSNKIKLTFDNNDTSIDVYRTSTNPEYDLNDILYPIRTKLKIEFDTVRSDIILCQIILTLK